MSIDGILFYTVWYMEKSIYKNFLNINRVLHVKELSDDEFNQFTIQKKDLLRFSL